MKLVRRIHSQRLSPELNYYDFPVVKSAMKISHRFNSSTTFKALVPLLAVVFAAVILSCTPAPERAGTAVHQAYIKEEAFVTADNAVLPMRVWPANPNPVRAVLVAVHGFNDYSNAFAELGSYLSHHHHITSYAYDQRGFGGSEKPGSWAGTETYVNDLRDFCQQIKARHPNTPLYVLGESMGGALAMVAFAGDTPPLADGVILSAPAVWSRPTMPWYQRTALFLAARLIPWASFTGKGIKVTPSDNRDMLIALNRDPLVIKATKVGAMYGLTNLMDEAMASAVNFQQPALVMIGDRDEIVPNHASALMLSQLPESAQVQQKIVVYQQGYHMLTRDLQGEVVMQDIATWIANHSAELPSGADQQDLSVWVEQNLPQP